MLSWPLVATALISAMDISGLLFVSYSASILCSRGSETGFRDNVSGALLRVPLTHSVVKL